MFVRSNLVLQWVPESGKVVRGDTKMSPGVLQRGALYAPVPEDQRKPSENRRRAVQVGIVSDTKM